MTGEKIDEQVWKELVDWVEQGQDQHHGGKIHEALTLSSGSGDATRNLETRGIFARSPISKGEILIRLPASCVLSGASHGKEAHSDGPPASPWLQCVGAYYRATSDECGKWRPYMKSLPTEYETLFQWKDEEIARYLAGTTLGEIALADRTDNHLRKRYQTAVRPYLLSRKLIVFQEVISKDEYDAFLRACMCISTRGFHLSADDHSDIPSSQADDVYAGPFLLPVIDLLNHNPIKKCTTLQRDSSMGAFYMVAERNIAKGEEILHSYGETLTSAQLLQTFGFVPPRLTLYKSELLESTCFTPAILHKEKHLLSACKAIKNSAYPKGIRDAMASTEADQLLEDCEVWEVEDLQSRPLSDDDAPDDWVVSWDQRISDELITFMVLQFLPQEAYDEMVGSDGRISAWLDQTILEDDYLRCLVLKSIQHAIEAKKAEYVALAGSDESLPPAQRDILHLEDMSNERPNDDVPTNRRIQYGLCVRIEEMLSLHFLEKRIDGLMAAGLADGDRELRKTKRPKVESSSSE